MKKILAILCIYTCTIFNAFSYFSLFNLDNLNNQLSNNAILCMYQDHYGFMWFGTYDGLNLYDGKEVTTFRFESGNPYSLSGNSIHKIMHADETHLWIATQIGLDKFSLTERKVIESYPNYKMVNLMATNSKGETWLMNENNFISYYNGQQNGFNEIILEQTDISDVKSMFIDENEQLCLVKKDGILLYLNLINNTDKKTNEFTLIVKEKTFHDKPITYVFYEDRQISFIDEDQNLFIYDIAKHQKIYLRNLTDIINKYGLIASLCFFENDVFIGFMFGGLVKLHMANIEKWEPVNTTIGIFSLMKDNRQSAMWVATDGRGVGIYYRERDIFGNIYLENLPFTARRPVRAIYTDKENSLWIGTKGDGIIRIKDYDKFNNKPIPKSNADTIIVEGKEYKKPVYRFLRSKYNENDLWIAADKLYYYSYKNDKVRALEMFGSYDRIFPDEVHTLFEINDSTLWVSSKGLWQIVLDKTQTPYNIKNKKRVRIAKDGNNIEDVYYSMIYDGDSIATLGCRNGYGPILYNIPNAQYEFVSMGNARNKAIGDAICLHKTGDSVLYLGASSGLSQIKMTEGKENQIKQFGRKDGIINDMIHGILEDNTGIIWLSTNKGLVKYNPKNDSFFNVKSYKIGVSEFSDNASWHCPFTDRLFFGGVNGLTWIEIKKEDNIPVYEPDLLFTELFLYGKEQTLLEYNNNAKVMTLQSNQNTFQIKFAVLDYLNGENYDYSYMLENYDPEWVSLQKENRISFTKLPPGEYILKVKYKNDVTNAENKVYSMLITILPPWYLSQIAYIIYTFIFVLLLLFIFFYVRWKFRKKQEIVAKQIKREQKEKLYESKMKFFTNITHELYTPLTLINGAITQISKTDQLDHIRKYTSILQNNVISLNELIQEILDYRRIEEGRIDNQKLQKVSITNLVDDLISSFTTVVTKNNIDLNVSIPDNLYWYTDKSSIKKIITNLLSNAFKYTPENGMIKVDVGEENSHLKIIVYNTGKGIEKDKLKSIFNRFQILEDTDVNANNQMTARNGLGLFICHSMTKLLKGELTVRSEVDHFAEFTVVLPVLMDDGMDTKEVVEDKPEEVKREIKLKIEQKKTNIIPVQNDNSNLPILIVDDNREIVELVSDILSPTYRVLKAFSVAEARKVLINQTPALIITDIMMPETDGLSFIRMLREDKYNKHLPIIALSAKIDEKDVVKGYETGADTYITKPFSPDILLSVVDRFLLNKEEIKSYYETAESAFTYESGKLMHIEDRKFIETLSEIVKENINNPDLNPEFIADKMKLSSRGLYRQLKKILSVSLRDFIKDYRLSYAARLLLTTNLSVKEIIHKIGFSNKSYFYNEFFKKYNASPKQYQDINKNQQPATKGTSIAK